MNQIYNIDCLVGMRQIPDKSIDMILCDLPYGTTQNQWDSVIPLDALWREYERIIKDNGAIVLTAQTPFDKVLGASNLKLLRYEWIWEKEAGTGFLNAKKMPLKNHENILVFYKKLPIYNPQMREGKSYKGKYSSKNLCSSNYGESRFDDEVSMTYEGRYPVTILKFPRDTNRLHPTQKPVALMEYLIRTYTNEGDVVLDNCVGSGSTIIACLKSNRQYIGFEIDKKSYDISLSRVSEFIQSRGEDVSGHHQSSE